MLLGSGLGYALSGLIERLQANLGQDYALAVVDREESILAASKLRERFPQASITWISAESPQDALRDLSLWQQSHGGLPLFPIANPFYLRLDRDYYGAVRDAALASARFDFWGKTNYPRFATEKPRLLLLTSKYFLMGEVTASCDRLGLPRTLAGEYDTVAGLVLHQLGHMPRLGEVFTVEGYRFEVIDMDGLRIDKVLVARV